MKYVLTESHPNRGFKGLSIDRDGYIAIPYYDRALFEVVPDSNLDYYYCSLEVIDRSCKTNYLLVDEYHVMAILHDFFIENVTSFICKEIKKGNVASLTSRNKQFIFRPIKS